ncbi:hypothetical protein [Chitinasiproducens palmae]|uniref:hypothetical protein n=1 Tax=Chitinasiproducens palmae TaxID=1770053 RepID=UPI00147D3480|nr:hypothetical protein [Chitinasiproducens palmae]
MKALEVEEMPLEQPSAERDLESKAIRVLNEKALSAQVRHEQARAGDEFRLKSTCAMV